jgi:hypothetical protein
MKKPFVEKHSDTNELKILKMTQCFCSDLGVLQLLKNPDRGKDCGKSL